MLALTWKLNITDIKASAFIPLYAISDFVAKIIKPFVFVKGF